MTDSPLTAEERLRAFIEALPLSEEIAIQALADLAALDAERAKASGAAFPPEAIALHEATDNAGLACDGDHSKGWGSCQLIAARLPEVTRHATRAKASGEGLQDRLERLTRWDHGMDGHAKGGPWVRWPDVLVALSPGAAHEERGLDVVTRERLLHYTTRVYQLSPDQGERTAAAKEHDALLATPGAAPEDACRHGYMTGTFCSECPNDVATAGAAYEVSDAG